MPIVSRTERSSFAAWWWSTDKPLLIAVLALAGVGIMLSFATSPVLAARIGADSFFLVKKQMLFLVPALGVLLVISALSIKWVRRLALLMLVGSLAALFYATFLGVEYNGAKRWISFGGFQVQPVEFVKPAFVLVSGMIIAKSYQERSLLGHFVSFGLLILICFLLLSQPDVGQAVLIAAAWCGLIFLSGASWGSMFGMLGLLSAGVFGAYSNMPYVKTRIDTFLNPESSGGWQLEQAQRAITSAGWFGRGPGEGVIKAKLPDAHSDFVFSVLAEEFGIFACLALIGLFAFIVLRGLYRASSEPDDQNRFAAVGLFMLFGLQALVNIGVNLQVLPPKGMTLPLVSAGGSSLLAICITMGFAACLIRRRPGDGLLRRTMLSDFITVGGDGQRAHPA